MDTITTNTTTKRYVCNGTCGGSVTEDIYIAGKTVCGTVGCTMLGQPFVEKVTQTTTQVVNPTVVTEDVIINNG